MQRVQTTGPYTFTSQFLCSSLSTSKGANIRCHVLFIARDCIVVGGWYSCYGLARRGPPRRRQCIFW